MQHPDDDDAEIVPFPTPSDWHGDGWDQPPDGNAITGAVAGLLLMAAAAVIIFTTYEVLRWLLDA